MKHPRRTAVFLVCSALLLAVFCWGLAGLDSYGQYTGAYGIFFNQLTVMSRHITNVPTAINFDFRGIDTMGEEYILFGSVLGTLVLLRQLREEQESEGDDQAGVKEISEPSGAVRLLGLVLLVLLIMFGIYIILHAHMTPGGGFQGGAIVGTAMLLVYLTGGYNVYSGISPPNLMEFLHAGAAGSYVAIGLSGLIVGGVFLSNILPLGTSGHFASGGTIPLINDAVGLEVSNGFAIIFHEFVTQTRRRPT